VKRHHQSPQEEPCGRLAFRVDGDFWNAYYADDDTMDDAFLLGSLHMRFVIIPERRAQFITLMQEAVGDITEEVLGMRPVWPDAQQLERETQH
jgi:hypothetical protein